MDKTKTADGSASGRRSTCALCRREKPLVRSHIIPEWCYKPVYDGQHRLQEIWLDPNAPNRRIQQKGIRERLLCLDCEALLSPHEKYMREVIFGGVEFGRDRKDNRLLLSGLDYHKIKLFQMSVLWRAAVSSDEHFRAVQLGEHEEKLREMLLKAQPGEPHEYGCIMFALVTTTQKKPGVEMVDGLIMTPKRRKLLERYNGYMFIFGGMAWLYVVSKESGRFPYQEAFAAKTGTMTIEMIRAEDKPFFTLLAREIIKRGKLPIE